MTTINNFARKANSIVTIFARSITSVFEEETPEYIREYENPEKEKVFAKARYISMALVVAFMAYGTFGSSQNSSSGELVPLESGVMSIGSFSLSSLTEEKEESGIYLVLETTESLDEAFYHIQVCAKQGLLTNYRKAKQDGQDVYRVVLTQTFESVDDAKASKNLIPSRYRADAWIAVLTTKRIAD